MVTSTTSAASTASDPATIGSALVTALGGGTGIDMTALATNLATASFTGRLNSIDARSARLDTQISEAGQLKSDLLALASSMGTRVRAGDLAASPAVANSAVAQASLPLGSSGASGSYSLEVLALAQPQVLASPALASAATTTGSGSLTINFGTVSSGTFAADTSHSPVTVNIAAGATLADVAQAINSAGAGLSAYVATAADGARLVIKGQQGAASGFTISASEAPGDPGLSALAFDPATAPAGRLVGGAADAQFKLDGIARTSTTNQVADAAPGLSLKLTGTNAGAPTQISFSDPASAITGAMQDLTSALNTLGGALKSNLDPASGGLSADSAARTLQRRLGSLTGATIMPNVAAGTPATLGNLGLSVQKDGTFALDGARLTAALRTNPQAVAAMFTTGLYGVYGTLDALARNVAAGSDAGSLGGSVNRYSALKSTLSDQRGKLTTQQDTLRTQLVSRFAKANSAVAASNSTLTYLKNQVAGWNKSGN